jgi:hypothetical protein
MKLPREHGAWAMLLLPFAAALVLARQITWVIVPALLACLSAFILRDSAAEVYRRKYIWRRDSAELRDAVHTSALCVIAAAASGIMLLFAVPVIPLAVLGAAAGVLMVAATYLTAHNKQRSVALQVASAAGLTASAFIAWLACGRTIDATVWLLWGVLFAHSAASMLTVHARLEARIAARKTVVASVMRTRAAIAEGMLLVVAAWLANDSRWALAAALAVSAVIHAFDLTQLYNPDVLRTRLQVVGIRELVISCVVAALTVKGLY